MKKFILAIIAVMMFSFSAQAADKDEILFSFDNWRIESIVLNSGNETFILIGVGEITNVDSRFFGRRDFSLRCNNILIIPYDLKANTKDNYIYQPKIIYITVWSYTKWPILVPMTLMGPFVLLQIDQEKEQNVQHFIDIMLSSNEYFSYSFGAKLVKVNTKELKAAWSMFKKLCSD